MTEAIWCYYAIRQNEKLVSLFFFFPLHFLLFLFFLFLLNVYAEEGKAKKKHNNNQPFYDSKYNANDWQEFEWINKCSQYQLNKHWKYRHKKTDAVSRIYARVEKKEYIWVTQINIASWICFQMQIMRDRERAKKLHNIRVLYLLRVCGVVVVYTKWIGFNC